MSKALFNFVTLSIYIKYLSNRKYIFRKLICLTFLLENHNSTLLSRLSSILTVSLYNQSATITFPLRDVQTKFCDNNLWFLVLSRLPKRKLVIKARILRDHDHYASVTWWCRYKRKKSKRKGFPLSISLSGSPTNI